MGLRELDQTIEDQLFCICFVGSNRTTMERTGPFPPDTECTDDRPCAWCSRLIETEVTNNWTILPSDGLFSVEVQSNIPQATEDPVIISKDNPSQNWNWLNMNTRIDYGSTHMAIRNDDIGKNALIKLFEGDFGLFYETEETD